MSEPARGNPRRDSGSAPSWQGAGIVTRSLAAAVDIGVVVGIVATIYGTLVLARLLISPRQFSWPVTHVWFSMTAVMVIATLYLTTFWATSGRTVGCVLLGIRVTSAEHTLLRWTGCALRAILCVVFPVGLLWVVFDPRRRSLQDVLLRTRVVYDTTPR